MGLKTDQFERNEKKKGFNGVSAIIKLETGNHIALVAPNVDALRDAWDRLSINELDESRVQDVCIVQQ